MSKLTKKLTDKHKDWISIVQSFGIGSYSEDLVQEMYIRAIKYIRQGKDLSYGDDINHYYIFKLLRHLSLNLIKKKKKINVISIENHINEVFDQKLVDYEEKYKIVNKKLDNLYWYEQKVYRIIESGTSITELAEKSNISYYSLYRTYNKVKKQLKLELWD